MQARNPADFGAALVAAILMLVAGGALWQSAEFSQFGSLFPRAIGVALFASAAIALVRALAGRGKRSAGMPQDGLGRGLLLMLVMVGWIAALEPIGFIPSSIVAFVLLALIANRDPLSAGRIAMIVVMSFVVVIAFQQLFVEVLHVNLPRGHLKW